MLSKRFSGENYHHRKNRMKMLHFATGDNLPCLVMQDLPDFAWGVDLSAVMKKCEKLHPKHKYFFRRMLGVLLVKI